MSKKMKQETYLVWFQLNGYVVIIIINRMKREKIININEWCLERKNCHLGMCCYTTGLSLLLLTIRSLLFTNFFVH